MDKPSSSFSVLYRFYLLESKEEEYVRMWKQLATYFKSHRGAIASKLYKTDEGYWAALSTWPDQATRDASWSKDGANSELPSHIVDIAQKMKECSDPHKEIFEDIILKKVDAVG